MNGFGRNAPGSRQACYRTMLAISTGVAAVGLLVPYVFGDPIGDPTVAAGAMEELVDDDRELVDDAIVAPGPDGVRAGGPGAGATADLASAPGAEESEPTAPDTSSGPIPPEATPTAAQEKVRIGMLLLDLGGIGELGFQGGPGSPELQRKIYEALVADANERNLASAREIEAVYVTFNPLEESSMQAACQRLAQDEKVFAALNVGGYYGDAILCLTERYEVGFFAGASEATPWYQRSGGRFFSLTANKDRLLANQAGELDRLGVLTGKKIGILTKEPRHQDGAAVVRTLEPVLRSLGHTVAYRTELSNDAGTASTQMPVAVSQMRQAGVDFVVVATNTVYATQFVQQAESQGFLPAYSASDFAQGTVDFSAQNMPRSYDGALGITSTRINEHRQGLPEPERDRACRELITRRSGIALERGSDEYGTAVISCDLVQYVAAGLGRAGPRLRLPSWSSGMQSLGPVALANSGNGSFRAGKYDASDQFRLVRWEFDCKCWLPAGPFRAGRY